MTENQLKEYLKERARQFGVLVGATCKVTEDHRFLIIEEKYAPIPPGYIKPETLIYLAKGIMTITPNGPVMTEATFAEVDSEKTATFFWSIFQNYMDKMQRKEGKKA